MSRKRTLAIGAGLAAAGAAMRSTGARDASPPTRSIRTPSARRRPRPGPPSSSRGRASGARDLAVSFAPSTATTWSRSSTAGSYFPRMLADIAAARSSIHLLIYGFQAGEIGTRFRDALTAQATAGASRSASRSTRSAVPSILAPRPCCATCARPASRSWRTTGLFWTLKACLVGPISTGGSMTSPLRPPQDAVVDGGSPTSAAAGSRTTTTTSGSTTRWCASRARSSPSSSALPDQLALPRRHAADRSGPSITYFPPALERRRRVPPRRPSSATSPVRAPSDQRHDRATRSRTPRADPHRQSVHLQPGDPGAAPGGRARGVASGSSPRASRRRPIRRPPSATTTAACSTRA